jgi:DNA polymerase III delta subunit
MLAVFFGSDQMAVREEVHKYIDSIIEVGQDIERIEGDGLEKGALISLASSEVLFGKPPVYLIDTLSNQTEMFEDLLEQLEVLAKSPFYFVVLEKDLNANSKKQFTKHASVINEFKKSTENKTFNSFLLAEALVNKDKKQLWILLQEARKNNISSEEIIGILWWQLKTIRLAKLTKNAEEAGVKDFPYNKAKRALKNFKDGELETLSLNLLTLYHNGHAGKRDIDLALEEWVLRG